MRGLRHSWLIGRKLIGRASVPLALLLTAVNVTGAKAAVTIHTAPHLLAWTNYNGFEGLGRTITFNGQAGYAEQGITATYFGSPGVIMSTVGAAEGRYSWYPNAGSNGYTSITFGGVIEAVSFLAGTGFGGASSPKLYYELRLGGATIASGQAGALANYGDGWRWFGFSGAQFDELRVQARSDQQQSFQPSAYDALSLDGIRFNGYWSPPEPELPPDVPGVPDAPMWAMLLAGFGLTGLGARRKSRLS